MVVGIMLVWLFSMLKIGGMMSIIFAHARRGGERERMCLSMSGGCERNTLTHNACARSAGKAATFNVARLA